MDNSRFLLVTLIALSFIMGVYEGFLFTNGLATTHSLDMLWGLIFVVMMMSWVFEDSKKFSSIYRPFDYGFILYIFYIPYIPYYLIKTRGALGVLYLAGFILLFNAGYLAQWIIIWLE